ncbi:MAG: glycosyltransferase family 1 protein [Lachnospiraceae bacterium]|nr:glycosyltransferase family 1 protein [Lachnospiraceae bacterium]
MEGKNTVLVIKGSSEYGVLREASDRICQGFGEKGYEIQIFDLLEEVKKNGNQINIELEKEMSKPYSFIFSVQACASEIKIQNNNTTVSILEKVKCPYIGWIFDHPEHHFWRLNQIKNDVAHIGVIDKTHIKYINHYIGELENKFFLPHGGFAGDCELLGFEDRNIEIFCPGTCGKRIDIEPHIKVYGETVRTIYNAVYKMAEDNPDMEVFECIEKYMKEIGMELDKEGFGELKFIMELVDNNIRYQCKSESVRVLLEAGYQVHVAGKYWESLLREYPHNLVVVKEDMDIQEVIKYMQRSKIVLNLAPTLSTGLHERILTGLMAKAAVITPYNSYIAEELAMCESLSFFTMNNIERLPQIVSEILQDENMEEKTSIARQYTLENHTWEKRGEEIVAYVEALED